MARMRNPPGSGFATAAGLVVALVLLGSVTGAALWFQAHLGSPPPIVVVAQPPAVTVTASATPKPTTTTAQPLIAPDTTPAQVPGAAAYTGAATPAIPGFENKSANQYGWFSGDGTSARCDEWDHASVVGSTAQTLFVVCGTYFKAYELATGTPIRIGFSSGGDWSGSGAGIAVRLTRDTLTLARDGVDPQPQPVVAWWAP